MKMMNHNLQFYQVIEELRKGKRAMRKAWCLRNEFIYLVPGSEFYVTRHPLLDIFEKGTLIRYREHIDMCFQDGSCGMWDKTREDIVAHDWEILE
jgi:hypothetical protein